MDRTMMFAGNRSRDVLVMGRANVDMYVSIAGESLGESRCFEKSVGGCAANISVGLARLDRRVDLLSMVSRDPFGAFVCNFLNENNVGTGFIRQDDTGSLTSLAFAERNPVDSEVLFYRNGASDLMLDVSSVEGIDFREWAVFVVTGTGLSGSPSREATLLAMERAVDAGTKVVFDLDWRASAWDSTIPAGMVYRMAAERSHIILGTRGEFKVLGDLGDRELSDMDIASRFLGSGTELVLIKRGSRGSIAAADDGRFWEVGIYPVEVKKNYGAGDAFAAAMIHGLMDGLGPLDAMRLAAAAAGIVVSGEGCASSSPDREELQRFIDTIKREL